MKNPFYLTFLRVIFAAGVLLMLVALLPAVHDFLVNRFLAWRSITNVEAAYWHLKFYVWTAAGAALCAVALTLLSQRIRTFLESNDKNSSTTRKKLTNCFTSALAIIFLFACGFFVLITNSTWLDEVVTLQTIRHPFSEIISIQQNDVHPPLYLFYAKIWAALFGDSLTIMRLSSLLPVAATFFAGILFLRREFSSRAALVFSAGFATSFNILYYCKEIRMYGLAMFFVTCTAIAGFYLLKRLNGSAFSHSKTHCITFLFFALCAAYTHYYAAVLVGLIYVALFFIVWKEKRSFSAILPLLLVAGGAIILYLPWLPTVLSVVQNVSNDFWIKKMTVARARDVFSFPLAAGDGLSTLCVVALFAVLTFVFLFRKKTAKTWFAFALPAALFLLATAGVVHDFLAQPLFVARYLLPGCALIWLFAGVASQQLKTRRSVIIALACLVLPCAMSVSRVYFDEDKLSQKYNAIFGYIQLNAKPDDVFYIPDNLQNMVHRRCVLLYLFPRNAHLLDGSIAFHTIGGPTDERASRRLFFQPKFINGAGKSPADTLSALPSNLLSEEKQNSLWIILDKNSPLEKQLAPNLKFISTDGEITLYQKTKRHL